MEFVPHHQCFLYEGSPELNVPCLGKALKEMLSRNYRCLYLNSEQVADAMQVFLAGAGVNVEQEMRRGSLILSSDRGHLMNGRFDLKGMLLGLEEALSQSLADGYAGLFATGDMSWEFGPDADFSELMEYEWKLEDFFEAHPQLMGICQYHANSLPPEVMKQGLIAHPGIYVNEELSLPNPHFEHPRLAMRGSF